MELPTICVPTGAWNMRAGVSAEEVLLAEEAPPVSVEPVRLEASIDSPLSQWLWLVKWFLAIPHFIVLFFLWIAFFLLTLIAGIAILFTGRYPKAHGVRENGMIVWRVAERQIAEVGAQLARSREVSHCYARNPIEGFPYTLYSIIHGPDRESCRATAAQLSHETGIDDYAVLFSEREFKKVRLRYFLPELDAWWTARAGR